MIFTASLTTGAAPASFTVSGKIEFPDGSVDVPARLRAFLEQLTAAANQTCAMPAIQKAAPVQPAPVPNGGNGHNATNGNGHAQDNGNGENGKAGISPKQKGYLLGLGAKLGLKLADLNQRARAHFGPDATIHNLDKREAGVLIDQIKAEAPAAKGE